MSQWHVEKEGAVHSTSLISDNHDTQTNPYH